MSSALPNSSVSNDFDTNQIIRHVEDHAKDIVALLLRVKELEDKFGNNEKIADTLSETAEKAVKMQTMLQKTFVLLLETNEPVRCEIKKLIKSTDREFVVTQWRQWRYLVIAAFIFLTAQVSIEVVKWLFRLFTHS